METLLLIPIVILSVLEGIDPHKGLLFSYYFYSFKGNIAYLVPILTSIVYYLLGILLVYVLPLDSSFLLKIIIFYLLLLHSIAKVLIGKILHYSGNMKPTLSNLITYSFVNSLLQMSLLLVLAIAVFMNYIILFLVLSIIIKEIVFEFAKNSQKILLSLTKYNFDYIYVIGVLLIFSLLIIFR
ncbi:hypothetical protein [Acidianus manzaensis]|uniref:Uncharacterized protein n=1 Tax=Acidianus manzaensis TaxID=282676 RepID=A0A1W6JWK1_9CREN|nr:hypothetical protein [Acidianus manzaensis]ARM74666.1 hypothetical protein B6F84_00580 [Acidianus manzaensis]